MSNEELEDHLREIKITLEVMCKATADQQVLNIRLMAHQQAHLAAIRHLLVRLGEDRAGLNQSLRSAYESALNLYKDQLQSYHESGDVNKFVSSLVFPDEIQSN